MSALDGSGVDASALVDQSAAIALRRAAELRARLNDPLGVTGPGVEAARMQLHRLIVDIVSLRNAAELLKRGVGQLD